MFGRIKIGDQYEANHTPGSIWIVTAVKPGGIVELDRRGAVSYVTKEQLKNNYKKA